MIETAGEKEQAMRDYLLGNLGAEESVARENTWFDNDEDTERLEAMRAELVDEFLTDSFSPAEKRDFERYFLASRNNINLVAVTKIHRESIDKKTIGDFDRMALTVNSETEKRIYDWRKIKNLFSFKLPQLAFAASLIVVIFGLIYAVRLFTGSENQIAQIIVPAPSDAPMQTTTPVVSPTPTPKLEIPVLQKPSPSSTQRKDDVLIKPPETRAAEIPLPTAPKQKNSIAALALVLGVRGDSDNSQLLKLSGESKTAILNYEMPALMQTYDEFSISVISEKTGQAVYRQKTVDLNFRQKGAKLSAPIPASVFQIGEYQFVLSGKPKNESAEVLAIYKFKVQK